MANLRIPLKCNATLNLLACARGFRLNGQMRGGARLVFLGITALGPVQLDERLTGVRINAICDLKARDCQGGAFTFKRAKKEPRCRTVSVHSGLKGIVARRCEGKNADEFLFHELPAATATRPRSAAASQAFTRYCRKVGVGANKGEPSKYDFHSFRRWFTTKAEQAGQPRTSSTMRLATRALVRRWAGYSEGPSMAQMRKSVEAVKLPPNVSRSASEKTSRS
jgi:hypothetical protein